MRSYAWVCVSALAVAASIGACSSSYGASEPPETASDAMTSDAVSEVSAVVDAGDAGNARDAADAARCNPSSPFTDKHALAELNSTAVEYGITLSPDELTAHFGSNRGGAFLLYKATRTSRAGKFTAPTLALGVMPAPGDSYRDPSLSADGLTIYFEHSPQTGGAQLQFATRANQQAPFSGLTELTALSPQALDVFPNVTPDGLELFYAHYEATGATKEDLYVLRRPSIMVPFGAGSALAELNTPAADTAPAISADGLTLFFTTATADSSLRVSVTRRPNRQAAFGTPVPVAELVGPGTSEQITWVSPDGCAVYYISLGGGTADLWVATRAP